MRTQRVRCRMVVELLTFKKRINMQIKANGIKTLCHIIVISKPYTIQRCHADAYYYSDIRDYGIN